MQNKNFNIGDLKGKSKNELLNMLSQSDKEKVNSILNDKESLEKLLKSPEAVSIMNMLKGNKNG